jgi:monovalent cation:H+ antiporter-2, CPA2 family
MPHNVDLILLLAGGLTAAWVFGFLTHRLGLSPIVGYLLGGIVVGPFTPGFVADHTLAEQCAEIGVILLMFGVGLHFHVKELLDVRRVALPGAILQSAAATGLGALVGRAFGWSWSAGIVLGLAIAVASTVVLTRVLEDNRALHTKTGHIAIGWLVVEDLFTVLVLVLLPVLVGENAGGDWQSIARAIGIALLKVGALVVFTFVFGAKVLPTLLHYVAKTRSRELFTLTILVLALGIAVGSAKLFGASMALGAFLAGMVVGQSDLSSRAGAEVLPLRDAFAVLFFVSVGMLFDPMQLWDGAWLTLAVLGIVIIGKPLVAFAVVVLLRYPLKTALAVGVALGQIGEFSFIVAAVGRQLGVLPESASQALVVTSIVSITINPLLYRLIDPAARRLARSQETTLEDESLTASSEVADRAVVVGYGPVGRVVLRVLRENGFSSVVIELNHETVAKIRREGTTAVYGDAAQLDILERAGIRSARALILTADSSATDATVRAARELNPNIFVMARAAFASQLHALERAGATVALASEVEVALSMTTHLMQRLGAKPEQLDSERERARLELAG